MKWAWKMQWSDLQTGGAQRSLVQNNWAAQVKRAQAQNLSGLWEKQVAMRSAQRAWSCHLLGIP